MGSWEYLVGDVREVLATLPEQSIQTIVTSPPYWGLRDYGIPKSVWPDGWEGCLGLEPTPEMFIEHMVEVCRGLWRVLRDDGTMWLNLGDCYARQAGDDSKKETDSGMKTGRTGKSKLLFKKGCNRPPPGLKPKDLVMMPHRVALALQAEGWYVRSTIVWSKPNPMPESCTDRPTSAHEYIFLLTKNARYFYDADAVREKGTIPEGTLAAKGSEERRAVEGVNARPPEYKVYSGTRNLRNVWSITTQPYPEAHFATFPERIPELCIKAGTSEKGCCPSCGASWERVVEVSEEYTEWAKTQRFYGEGGKGSAFRMAKTNSAVAPPKGTTKGFQPTCKCPEHTPIPCTVLDPFAGSGTTIKVARDLGRSAIGIDISPEYKQLAIKRAMLDTKDILSYEEARA